MTNPGTWLDLISLWAQRTPAATALRQGDRTVSYGALERRIGRLAGRLRQRFGPDARLAIWLPNDIHGFVLALAAMRAGASWAPINPRSQGADAMAFAARAGCAHLLYHETFADDVPAGGAIETIRLTADSAGLVDLDAVERWPDGAAPPAPGAAEGAILFGTSGSTGTPKVVHTRHRNLRAMCDCFAAVLGPEPPRRFLAVTPLTHTAGTVALTVLASGGTVIVQPRFEPLAMARAIADLAVDLTYLPPTGLYKLLASPGIDAADFSSLRYFLVGGMPLAPDKLKEAVARFGPALTPCYGQVEALWISFSLGRDWPAGNPPWTSCGRVAPGVELRVATPSGEPVAPGEVGEIVVRSAMVADGDGWHRTGDLGRLDADGYLSIIDRTKDMIISGGFNVSPSEVEAALFGHPAVADCAAFGAADPLWGEAVQAAVVVRPGQATDAAALIAHCRRVLADFKCPKAIAFVDALPRTATGKASRRQIAAAVLSAAPRPPGETDA